MNLPPDPISRLISRMPDIVKLTIVGIGIDPPTIDPTFKDPAFLGTLDALVDLGITVVAIEGARRRYTLTQFGCEVFDVLKTQVPSDGTLPANDNWSPPGAA